MEERSNKENIPSHSHIDTMAVLGSSLLLPVLMTLATLCYVYLKQLLISQNSGENKKVLKSVKILKSL